MVENNPKLQTFMANECSNISNKVYSTVAKHCRDIEEVAIQMDDKFAVDSLENMRSLKTLIISKPSFIVGGCWGVKETKFI